MYLIFVRYPLILGVGKESLKEWGDIDKGFLCQDLVFVREDVS